MKRIISLLALCVLTTLLAYSQPGNGNPFGNMSREEIEELFRKVNTPPSDPAYRMEEAGCVSNGNKIYGEAFIPLSPGKHPAVILSHGYGGTHSGFYALADKLAKAGYVAYCYDFAGGSPRSQSEGRTEDMSILTESRNLQDVVDMVRGWDFVDKKNVFLRGESQGGCVSAITAPAVKKKINASCSHSQHSASPMTALPCIPPWPMSPKP